MKKDNPMLKKALEEAARQELGDCDRIRIIAIILRDSCTNILFARHHEAHFLRQDKGKLVRKSKQYYFLKVIIGVGVMVRIPRWYCEPV